MCGLTGYWSFKPVSDTAKVESNLRAMSALIESRGPDSDGVWVDEQAGLGLAHRRLSIIDLSAAGHQPMQSHHARYVMSYNGEIYNAAELRIELEKQGEQFIGYSDTEVLLSACEVWGIKAALQRVNGMFSFALWDKQERQLFLARDRLGIKPLYYGIVQGICFFGSQLKSLTAHPEWRGVLNQQAIANYLRQNYIQAPLSIYQNIAKLKPGHFACVTQDQTVKEVCYWDFDQVASQAVKNTSQTEQLSELEAVLSDAIQKRMVADVPLGAFLSGGIDSSTVAALMQKQSMNKIKTFSIGFEEDEYNEAQHAAAVAKHLGTDHHELYVPVKTAQDVIPHLPDWYDEPFADSSQVPTYLVSQLAREQVTVSLSGDGGDELFAGYNRYFLGAKIWDKVKKVPSPFRHIFSSMIQTLPARYWDKLSLCIPAAKRPKLFGDKVHKFANLLQSDFEHLYRSLNSYWDDPTSLLKAETTEYQAKFPVFSDAVQQMQYIDTCQYLPDDILAKVDRASMAVSLEARVPLLDHRVVEYAWQLPMSAKIDGLSGKHLLKQLLYQYVPQSLLDRPKMGFGVPIGEWICGDLRDWADDLLSKSALEQSGVFHAEKIRQCWQEHLTQKRDWKYALWGILMFQAWHQRWMQ